MMKKEQESHDQDFISISYGDLHSTYSNQKQQKALHQLNPSYKSSIRQKITGPLIEITYSKMQSKVNHYLNILSGLNVIMNESLNINKSRIANISIYIPIDSLH